MQADGRGTLWYRIHGNRAAESAVIGAMRKRGVGREHRLFEDALQEAYIEMLNKDGTDHWSMGECVQCAKRIAEYTAIDMRNRLEREIRIPPREDYSIVKPVSYDLESREQEVSDGAERSAESTSRDTLAWILNEAGEDDVEAARELLDGLPRSQRNVAMSLLRGDSVATIAARMGVKAETVNVYVRRIKRHIKGGFMTVAMWGGFAIFGLLASLVPMAVNAHDLGVQSSTYPITEPDFRAVLMGELAQHDLDEIRNGMADRAKDYTADLAPNRLPVVDETRTFHVDMSTTTQKDFYVPTYADGGLDWKLVAPAGTRLNPLEYIRPVTAFLVIDADDEKQRDFAIAARNAAPKYIKVLLSAGDPGELARNVDGQIFRASEWMMQRFHVMHEPALIRPGYGEHATDIAVTEMAPPWTLDALEKVDEMKATSIPQARQITRYDAKKAADKQ